MVLSQIAILKGIVHSEMIILQSFIHVILCDFLSFVELNFYLCVSVSVCQYNEIQ